MEERVGERRPRLFFAITAPRSLPAGSVSSPSRWYIERNGLLSLALLLQGGEGNRVAAGEQRDPL
jgi:hypothetical protein